MLRLMGCFFLLAAAAAAQDAVLIRAGRLLDVRAGQYATDRGVLVEKDRITQVGPFAEVQARAPKGAKLIDLSRGVVLPGLIDVHAHLLGNAEPLSNNPVLAVAATSPTRRALLGARHAREVLESGFTTVRNVGQSGVDGDASLRDAINAGSVVGPRMFACARKITPPGGQALPVMESATAAAAIAVEYLPVNGVEEARRAVRQAVADGADCIKVVADSNKRILREDEMRAIVEEAHRSGIKVAVHATTAAGLAATIAAAPDSIEHGDELTAAQLKVMRDKGIFYSPTAWSEQALRELFTVRTALTPEQRKDFEGWLSGYAPRARARVEEATRAGVKIAFGSDMWYAFGGLTRGQATMVILRALAEVGMAPRQALAAVTVNAAELLGWQDRAGSIEPGRFADIIAVEGDPLQDFATVSNVRFVMKGGVVVKAWQQ